MKIVRYALLTSLLGLGVAACTAESEPGDSEGQAEEVATSEEALWADCPADLPPCACTRVGSPVCVDADGDGLVNLDDNCDYTSNPGQQDCDGDGIGDACDSLNGTQTTVTNATPMNGTLQAGGLWSWCWGNALYTPQYRLYALTDVTTTTPCTGIPTVTVGPTRYTWSYSVDCVKSMGYCFGDEGGFVLQGPPPYQICW